MNNSLMCHVVAGYPTKKDCIHLMQIMDKTGVTSIEVQIPFSDPIADGETIMHANDVAVAAGMTVEQSFDLIADARRLGVNCLLNVMSYYQKVLSFGVERFCEAAKDSEISGLIIPDLPHDTQEYIDFNIEASRRGIEIIPVVSPGMSSTRLTNILKQHPKSIYVTSQKGITGNKFKNTEELEIFTNQIRQLSPSSQILIGFGISTLKDVKAALRLADTAVVGSALVRRIENDGIDGASALIIELLNTEDS